MTSLTWEILGSYRHPRQNFDRQLDRHVGEERILFYGILACFLTFVARLPVIAQANTGPDAPPLEAVIAGQFAVSLLMAPLLLYALAAVSHLLARSVGGAGGWRESRLALFWAVLASTPMVLVAGIVAVVANRYLSTAFLTLVAALFIAYWIQCLIRVEFDFRSRHR
ncbi:MAG: YIP1 family protein [Paracoccaceae bacterium]|nr:YIP1 family protein [Paracoccaceae bacterium]MDE2914398.1 YIP1 family protein [Paracoccaceae bacterium]